MSVTINEGDWLSILDLIADINRRPEEIELKWTLKILDEYAKVVSEAMGSVEARGGYVRMSYLGVTGKEYWKNLTPYTLAVKAGRSGKGLGYYGKSDYDTYASQFSIWVDTGKTKAAVDVYQNFAGIDAGQGDEYRKAARTEAGVPQLSIPPRRLFAIANKMFIEAVQKAFADEDSPMANFLREEFIKSIFKEKHRWGKGR